MQRTPWLAASFAALFLTLAGASTAQQPDAPGPGYGRGWGRDGPRMGRDYTPGWSMMTPQERDTFRQRMWHSRTRAECRQVFDEHRKLMEQRAGERGFTMRGPRRDPCAALRD